MFGNRASLVGWEPVDLIGCYGRQCAEAFTSLGIAPGRLALVGNIALDGAHPHRPNAARDGVPVSAKLTSASRRQVLFATSGVNVGEIDVLRAILATCAQPGSEAGVVVRPHPSLGATAYSGDLNTYGLDRVVVTDEGTIIDAIAAADVVITDYSTSGALAVLMGRPVLVINTTGAPFPANDYGALGVACVATSVADVTPALGRLLSEGWYWPNATVARRAFQDAYNWGGDGRAGERFLAEVAALAKRWPAQV